MCLDLTEVASELIQKYLTQAAAPIGDNSLQNPHLNRTRHEYVTIVNQSTVRNYDRQNYKVRWATRICDQNYEKYG